MKNTRGGRRKIEIKKIENLSSRYVTHCKRRAGVIKKASELCVLTGAEIAVLFESVGSNKVYSFGQPSVDSVIHTYLSGDNHVSNVGGENSSFLNQEYYEKYLKMMQELEQEKKKSNDIKADNGLRWWEQSVDDLKSDDELEKFIDSMEELKINVSKRADELVTNSSSQMISLTDVDRDGHNFLGDNNDAV